MSKLLHYCWFGGGQESETARKTIMTWKRYAREYRIIRWDESNCNINECQFTHEAYKAGAWAFVSDYFRLKAIYEYGGIYMDVGSELIKPLSSLECHMPYSAIERGTNTINPGLIIASEPNNKDIFNILKIYQTMEFVDSDEYRVGHTINEVVTRYFERQGFQRTDRTQQVGEWTLLSADCFCPKYGFGGYKIKQDTYSIHHYSASWVSEKRKTQAKVQTIITPYVGARVGEIISRVYSEYKHDGIINGTHNVIRLVIKHIIREDNNG